MTPALILAITDFFTLPQLFVIARAAIVLFIGLMIAKFFTAGISRAIKNRASPQQSMVIRRVCYYSLTAVAVASALSEFGIDLSVLLGAAGLLTVAIGFAARTSASNLISGLFLIGEQSFQVADVIVIGEHTGEVISVDLLSVKLRTFDNRFVRVPNEMLIASPIVNLSRFPIRRADLNLRVAFDADLDEVKKVLVELSEKNPICLAQPSPVFLIKGFGEFGVELQFSIWATQKNYLSARNQIQVDITKAFSDGSIGLPSLSRIMVSGAGINEA